MSARRVLRRPDLLFLSLLADSAGFFCIPADDPGYSKGYKDSNALENSRQQIKRHLIHVLKCNLVLRMPRLYYAIAQGSASMLPSRVMMTDHIVALLIAERDKLNAAIAALQGTKPRGRPPKNPLAAMATRGPAPKKGRRSFTAAQRKAASLRMKRRWAEKKKAAKG